MIKIVSCLTGAREATGTAVVIDVFRASNTIINILAKGAERVIAARDFNEAYMLKQESPEFLVFGEQNGLTPAGFDYNNSPAEADSMDFIGMTAVLLTSAGTRGIRVCKAREIIIGSFANAGAISKYLKGKDAYLVAMGLAGKEKAEEDELCAQYIREKAEGRETSFSSMREKMLRSPGALRLVRLGQSKDLDLCMRLDSHEIIPKVYKSEFTEVRL